MATPHARPSPRPTAAMPALAPLAGKPLASALPATALLAGALLLAAPPAHAGASGSVGAKTQTKVGCTSPDIYREFEEVYASDGRAAAYKVLARSESCMILGPTQVRLEEAVSAFDFGWGTGQVWRVRPLAGNTDAPETLFIRIRERDWDDTSE